MVFANDQGFIDEVYNKALSRYKKKLTDEFSHEHDFYLTQTVLFIRSDGLDIEDDDDFLKIEDTLFYDELVLVLSEIYDETKLTKTIRGKKVSIDNNHERLKDLLNDIEHEYFWFEFGFHDLIKKCGRRKLKEDIAKFEAFTYGHIRQMIDSVAMWYNDNIDQSKQFKKYWKNRIIQYHKDVWK